MSLARVKTGDVLGGKYRVERVLGAGGMGVVVAARHLELGQRVALKLMLKEAMVDPSHAERFLREARASVQLKSIHTARVLDVGKLPNGEPFMVMEYLEGKDLDQALRDHGPFPPHVACGYVLQVAEALAEAHGVGLIHRDVKLKNIFLTTAVDGRPLLKVLDFGLAKQTGIAGEVSLTATSSVFGSPQYMSPEQMRSAKDVDPRSDIWSLGVCLYELLTGRVPFDASGVAEICAMVLKDPVPPPSRYVRGLPADLEAVIIRCLEKDPRRRFQSVAEVAFALEPYGAEEGSGRRILQVMEGARKQELPTIVRDAPVVDEAHGKTMGTFAAAAASKSSRQAWIVYAVLGAVFGLMLTVGFGGIFYATRRPPAAAGATTTSPPGASEIVPLGPAPTAETLSVPSAMPPAPPVLPVTTGVRASDTARPAPTALPNVTVPKPPATPRTTATPAAPPKPPPPKPKATPTPTPTNPGDRF